MGYVYFVLVDSTRNIKIGYSTNIRRRIHTLQTSIPEKIKLLGYITGDMNKEKELHKMFRVHKIKGEWYRFDTSIIDYINTYNEHKLPNGMNAHVHIEEDGKIRVLGKIGI